MRFLHLWLVVALDMCGCRGHGVWPASIQDLTTYSATSTQNLHAQMNVMQNQNKAAIKQIHVENDACLEVLEEEKI